MILDEAQIRARLAETAANFPFPQNEIARTNMRQWILQYAPRGGIGAEIGVFRGHFSEYLLHFLSPRKMYLVDPWMRGGERFPWADAYTNNGALPTKVAFEEAKLRAALRPATETVFIESYFPACASLIREPLDWIYLDSTHAFDATLSELQVADRLLAPGGVILGDDWTPDRANRHHGVFRAVNAFVKQSEYEIVAAGPALQWCIRRSASAGT